MQNKSIRLMNEVENRSGFFIRNLKIFEVITLTVVLCYEFKY